MTHALSIPSELTKRKADGSFQYLKIAHLATIFIVLATSKIFVSSYFRVDLFSLFLSKIQTSIPLYSILLLATLSGILLHYTIAYLKTRNSTFSNSTKYVIIFYVSICLMLPWVAFFGIIAAWLICVMTSLFLKYYHRHHSNMILHESAKKIMPWTWTISYLFVSIGGLLAYPVYPMPTETILTKGADETRQVYVLQDEADRLVALEATSLYVVNIDKSQIACRANEVYNRTMFLGYVNDIRGFAPVIIDLMDHSLGGQVEREPPRNYPGFTYKCNPIQNKVG